MRAMGFLALGCLVVCNIWQNPNCRLGKPVLSWSSPPSRNYHMPYLEFLCFSSFGASILPPTISAPLAIINISRKELINLLLILNGVGITGRTIPVYIANQYAGPMNILFLVTIASVACSYGMVAVTTRGGLYAWTVAYGFVRNAVQGMFPVVLGSLTADKDSKKAGVRMSMMFVSASSYFRMSWYRIPILLDNSGVDGSSYKWRFDRERQWPLYICADFRSIVYAPRVYCFMWG